MEPTYVAIVPFEGDDAPPLEDLMSVAAALQTQVVRDLAPVWGVSGVVSPFRSLGDVPPGYLPLAVIKKDLPDAHGFHFATAGRPFALVRYGKNWSLAASHELLEMLCDPFGQRTAVGPSVAGGQDSVEYLVEVCDPVERSGYAIGSVLVSDFVTPAFYSAAAAGADIYSYSGAIKAPRQLLPGGALSWRTLEQENVIIQAKAPLPDGMHEDTLELLGDEQRRPVDPKALKYTNLTGHRSRLSREAVHPTPKTAPAAAVDDVAPPEFGPAFRGDVDELLGWIKKSEHRQPPSLQDVIDLLERLEKEKQPGKDKQPATDRPLTEADLRQHNIPGLNGRSGDRNPNADFTQVIEALKAQQRVTGLFGPDLVAPDLALWLCMLIN